MSEVPLYRIQGFLEIENTHRPSVPGYLGHKNTPAQRSVGRCFLNLGKPRAKPVGLCFLKLRKCTKAVGPCFLKMKKTHESGRSVFLKMRPVRATVLY